MRLVLVRTALLLCLLAPCLSAQVPHRTDSTFADCSQPGATYLRASCVYEGTVISTPYPLSGHNTGFYSFGPGGNPTVNAGEAPSTVVMSDDGYLANAAIRNIWQSTTAAFGVGDFVAMNWFHTGSAGVAFGSDEGIELIKNDGGQQEYWGGTARGYFQSTVLNGGSGTQLPVFDGQFGCTNLFQKCAPSAGSTMLDITQGGDTGFLTGPSVPFAAALPWLNQLPTTGGLAVASAWGYKLGANIAPDTRTDTPVLTTVTFEGGAGSFATGLVCVIGIQFEEQSIVTAVSGSSPTQTITLPLAYPNRDVAIFQGPCKFTSFNGDLALGTRTAYPGVSIDGTNLVYAVPNYGGMGWIILPGFDAETTAGPSDPNSGFATYCGARITKLTSLQPLATNLEQNGCNWAANDAVEDPDFPVQNIVGYTSRVNMNAPPTGNAALVGARISISGMGASGPSHGLEIDNLYGAFDCRPYTVCGGHLGPPDMIQSNALQPGGWWSNIFLGHYAPNDAILHFIDHAPGQTSYSILKDPWGDITFDNTRRITFPGAITVYGDIASAGGVSAGNGPFHAVWNGPSTNGLQIDFPPYSGRLPCHLVINDAWSWGGGRDLALGDGTRNGNLADASCGLMLGNLTANGAISAPTVSASLYQGPATAPTGSCSAQGWVFSQDGQATFCDGTTWINALKVK